MGTYNSRLIYQGLLLLLTAAAFGYLYVSGQGYQLAKPEAQVYALVFSFVMALMSAVSFWQGLKPGLKLKTHSGEAVYLSSLMLMIVLSATPITGAAFAGSGLLTGNPGYFYFGTQSLLADDSVLSDFNALNADKGLSTAEVDQDGIMTISDKYFVNMVDDLYINLDDFVGQKVRLQGFAIRMQGFNENQLVVSRLMMSCCAADSSAVGLMIEGLGVSSFKDDDWLEAEGVIDKIEYDGDTIPVIRIQQVKSIEPLKNKFVYYQQ